MLFASGGGLVAIADSASYEETSQMAAIYHYSLIRAVPDARRGEWVNVGIAVYLRDRLDVRLLKNLTKLRVLAPKLDVRVIEDLPETWGVWANGIESVEERQQILSNFPLFHVSETANFVSEAADYDERVEQIMRDLVMPPPAPRESGSYTRLERRLRAHFSRSKLLGHSQDDIGKHLIVNRFPVVPSEHLYADFALKNGKLRITETIDFVASAETLRGAKRGQAALKAVTLDRAMHVWQNECIPSVVYEANPATLDLIQPSLNLLASYCERLYDAANDVDLADYMSMMADAANAQIAGLAN